MLHIPTPYSYKMLYIIHTPMSQRDIVEYPEDAIVIEAYNCISEEDRIQLLKDTLEKQAANPAGNYVILTGLFTSDASAPCGCYGYSDHVCDFHRGYTSCARCFCCDTVNTVCSYHG